MPPLDTTIPEVARKIHHLDTGQLAKLRRLEVNGPGTPAYWRLASEGKFSHGKPETWMQLLKILAILTPKGKRRPDDRLHDRRRPLGAVLCDGGNPDWPPGSEPRPFLSETRLARFLALPLSQRGTALERLMRMLATQRNPANGLDCIELAFLLFPAANSKHLRKIAQAYYQRLDSANHQHREKENTP